MQRPTTVLETTEETMTLAEGVVREAVQLAQRDSALAIQTAFARGLARDGYVLSWDEYGWPSRVILGEGSLPDGRDAGTAAREAPLIRRA